jgi:hypothetical protein
MVLAAVDEEGALVEDALQAAGQLGPESGEVVGPHLVDDDEDREPGTLAGCGGDGPRRGRGRLEEEEESEHRV